MHVVGRTTPEVLDILDRGGPRADPAEVRVERHLFLAVSGVERVRVVRFQADTHDRHDRLPSRGDDCPSAGSSIPSTKCSARKPCGGARSPRRSPPPSAARRTRDRRGNSQAGMLRTACGAQASVRVVDPLVERRDDALLHPRRRYVLRLVFGQGIAHGVGHAVPSVLR